MVARDLDSKISTIFLIKRKRENRKIKKNLLASLSLPSSLPNLHLRIDFSCWRFLFLSLPHARCDISCTVLTAYSQDIFSIVLIPGSQRPAHSLLGACFSSPLARRRTDCGLLLQLRHALCPSLLFLKFGRVEFPSVHGRQSSSSQPRPLLPASRSLLLCEPLPVPSRFLLAWPERPTLCSPSQVAVFAAVSCSRPLDHR
jgi:hypothetical protein